MKAKRTEEIENYVIKQGTASLKELQELFDVSLNTIRRDINTITQNPKFVKVYGGVSVSSNELINYETRDIENNAVKREIAKQAASFINNGDIIYIDSGTTTKYILEYVEKELSFTVLTNNLDVVVQIDDFPNAHLVLIGDTYKRDTRSFVGAHQLNSSRIYNIDTTFMAATAVSAKNGLMNSDPLEYDIKQMVVSKASTNILLVDQTKFEKSTLITYAKLTDMDTVITDASTDYCEKRWGTLTKPTIISTKK